MKYANNCLFNGFKMSIDMSIMKTPTSIIENPIQLKIANNDVSIKDKKRAPHEPKNTNKPVM